MKLFELKGEDWMKALSYQENFPVGGLFQLASYDPFERMGYLQASLSSSELGASEVVTDINQIIPFEDNGVPYAYLFSDRDVNNKGVYKINLTSGAVTDVSSTFHTNLGSGTAVEVQGAIFYNNRIVYDQSGSLRRNTKAGATDTNIGSLSNGGPFYKRKGVLAAGVLYWPDGHQISTVDSSWTLTNAAFSLPTTFRIVSLESDGDNLAIIADENTISGAGLAPASDVTLRCQVRFWNMTSGTALRIWDIPDSYLVGSVQSEGFTYVFGASGIWTCTVDSSPKLLISFKGNSTITARPLSPYHITAIPGGFSWVSNIPLDSIGFSQRIHTYANPIPGGKKVFYTPYAVHGSTYAQTALAYCNPSFLVGTTSSHLYQANAGSTRGSAVAQTVSIPLGNNFSYEGVYINLLSPLASGDTVTIAAHTNNGNTVVSDSVTVNFTNPGAKQGIWIPKGAASANQVFENLTLTITTEQNATVSSVEVYGSVVDKKRVF